MMIAQLNAVETLAYDGERNQIHPQLLERCTQRVSIIKRYASHENEFNPRINAHFSVLLAAVAAGREELVRLHLAGDIDEDALPSLEPDLDIEELGALASEA